MTNPSVIKVGETQAQGSGPSEVKVVPKMEKGEITHLKVRSRGPSQQIWYSHVKSPERLTAGPAARSSWQCTAEAPEEPRLCS